MQPRWLVGALLSCSGFCSLVYQTVWLREFRLIFGASTAASAAVLAIFIGGLGAGGLLLGERAERHERPLALYGQLEVVIALTAAATPGLLWLVRKAYLLSGGSAALGAAPSTLLRLLLSALVLAVPTVAMGGTLPAATRAITGDDDERRNGFALLYAANTLGAVAGCVLSTFAMIEAFGNRGALWMACLLNLLVALTALLLARPVAPSAPKVDEREAAAPRSLVLAATALVGFVFFLMEMVWYRMLGPLLGGSVFTFGAILAAALLGVGAGSVGYAALGQQRRPTLSGFALTCLLEALFMAIPYAAGDRVATLAVALRPLGSFGFSGFVFSWMVVATLVVLPASLVSGVQFPLLVGLLGRGRDGVGSDAGKAYAWNTAGAIAGSLAGGFGLMPLLGALGCWRLVVALLLLLGLGAAAVEARRRLSPLPALAPLLIALVTALSLRATGPTAVWRHSPIGAGRVGSNVLSSPQALRGWYNHQRHAVRREFEGRESSVGLDETSGTSFVVNGKIDGNAIYDGPTQVMLGLVGAVLHPNPRRSLVIGLGTGSTAGWLAALPTTERVDVAELEPSILNVARECAPVNHDALANPRLRVLLGDARELATVGGERYDLVTSEPSNPYRAGIASLFTRDFYEIVARRLDEGGLFLQWVQAYEIDALTIRTIYASFRSVFPVVETWQLRDGDLLLVGALRPIDYDAAAMRERIAKKPLNDALHDTWRVDDLEGVLAHYVARPAFADAVAASHKGPLNTDDRCVVEFGFARGVTSARAFEFNDLRSAADARGDNRPPIRGDVDWAHVDDSRLGIPVIEAYAPSLSGIADPQRYQRALAHKSYVDGSMKAALDAWKAQPKQPRGPIEVEVLAGALADQASEEALPLLDRLRARHPADADGILAWLRYRQLKLPEAVAALEADFAAHRADPFASPIIQQRALSLAEEIGGQDRALARRLFDALAQPFVLHALDTGRLQARFRLARALGDSSCVDALKPWEPHPPWDAETLIARADCYQKHAHPLADLAARELAEFRRSEPSQVLPRLGLAPAPLPHLSPASHAPDAPLPRQLPRLPAARVAHPPPSHCAGRPQREREVERS